MIEMGAMASKLRNSTWIIFEEKEKEKEKKKKMKKKKKKEKKMSSIGIL